MSKFKPGDFANLSRSGRELTVRIMSEETNGCFAVGHYDDGLFTGRTENVPTSSLLSLRGPYFAIRGQVLTTSSSHPSEIGEIVGTGSSKSGKAFFKVQFGDGTSEWFNDDQVLIDDAATRAYDEAAKENEAFYK